jgi:hypothetical protein
MPASPPRLNQIPRPPRLLSTSNDVRPQRISSAGRCRKARHTTIKEVIKVAARLAAASE